MANVAAVHFTPELGACAENRAALVQLCTQAASEAQVVVLPELATTGFCMTREQADSWAEPTDGPTVSALAEVARAHGAVVVAGLALRDDGVLRNAQVVLDSDGSLAGVYAKHHLYGEDRDWAVAGDAPGEVVETAAGQIGLLICHDVVYPQTVMAVARARPRLLALSAAWIGDGSSLPMSWGLAIRLLDPAPLVVANRGGVELGVRFADPSLVLSQSHGGTVGPRGPLNCVIQGDLRPR